MTDPQNPTDPTQPPPAPAPASQAPPAYNAPPPATPVYGQQPYAAAPPPAYGAPATATVPGKTMGIVAFILSFFIQIVALILGIIALVQSRKAGHKNGWAVAAIIISSVLLVVSIIVAIVLIASFGALAGEVFRQCQELGPGMQEIGGVQVDCTDILNLDE